MQIFFLFSFFFFQRIQLSIEFDLLLDLASSQNLLDKSINETSALSLFRASSNTNICR